MLDVNTFHAAVIPSLYLKKKKKHNQTKILCNTQPRESEKTQTQTANSGARAAAVRLAPRSYSVWAFIPQWSNTLSFVPPQPQTF